VTKGEIILVEFPFTDQTGKKLRPALVLAEKNKDVLTAFITTNIKKTDELDLFLKADDKNKLNRDSILRLFRLAKIEKNLVIGTIGYIDDSLLNKIDKKLIAILKINI